jgi:hypothetical protein
VHVATLSNHGILFCLLTSCCLLDGCARQTTAQQTAIRTSGEITEARAEAKACLAQVREKPKYTTIISHYPDLETGQYSSDKSVPNAWPGERGISAHVTTRSP